MSRADNARRLRDPYNRAWVKVPTDTWDRPRFCDLSYAERGVLVTAFVAVSVPRSYDIGYFADRATNEPFTRAQICKLMRPREGDPVELDAQASAALQRFVEAGLAHEDDVSGYFFAPEIFEPWLHENNRIAKREADARRQREKRSRDAAQARAAEKKARPAAPPSSPPPSSNGHGKVVAMRAGRQEVDQP